MVGLRRDTGSSCTGVTCGGGAAVPSACRQRGVAQAHVVGGRLSAAVGRGRPRRLAVCGDNHPVQPSRLATRRQPDVSVGGGWRRRRRSAVGALRIPTTHHLGQRPIPWAASVCAPPPPPPHRRRGRHPAKGVRASDAVDTLRLQKGACACAWEGGGGRAHARGGAFPAATLRRARANTRGDKKKTGQRDELFVGVVPRGRGRYSQGLGRTSRPHYATLGASPPGCRRGPNCEDVKEGWPPRTVVFRRRRRFVR